MARIASALRSAAVFLALARSAVAGNGDGAEGIDRNLVPVLRPSMTASEPEGAVASEPILPVSLASVESPRAFEEPTPGLAGIPDFLLPPPKDPFVDFSKFEAGVFAGFVEYPSSYKAGPDYVLGISARVPAPGIPGAWAFFAEAFVSHIDQNLPSYYSHRSGSWYGAVAGADYTVIRGSVAYLRAQAGYGYVAWNNINSLNNGGGLLLGAQLGLFWIKYSESTSVTFTPEVLLENKEWIFLGTVGLTVMF